MMYDALVGTALGGLLIWVLYNVFKKRVKPPKKLSFTVEGISMKVARVRLNWTKSTSNDVVQQNLTVQVGQEAPSLNVLGPLVETFGPFDVPEKTDVHVVLTASDGSHVSDPPLILDFPIGDLEKPASPTGLTFVIEEIVSVP